MKYQTMFDAKDNTTCPLVVLQWAVLTVLDGVSG